MIRTATDIMMKRRYYHLPTRWIEQTLRWSLDIGLPGGTNHDNDNGQGTSDPVQFEDIPSEYTVVMVAFATTTDQFTPVFNPDPNFPFSRASVDAAHLKGQKVIISIGGAVGADFAINTEERKTKFVNGMIQLIDEYGFVWN